MNSTDRHPLHIGLLSAMPEELGTILDNLRIIKETKKGDLVIYTGIWKSVTQKEIIVTTSWSGWGKVSSARATTYLCDFSYENKIIDFLLFTGVAGGVSKSQKQWDIIIADSVLQHDMDARPIYKEFVIPALNCIKLYPDKLLNEFLYDALNKNKKNGNLRKFKSIYKGLVGTGDCFISDEKKIKKIKQKVPDLLAVEMEGAAFAQVAEQEKKKWILLRVISDNANNSAENDFNLFLKKYKLDSWKIIESFLNYLVDNAIK